MMDINVDLLASMAYNFFDKKSALLGLSQTMATRDKSASSSGIENENISNKELAEELHKAIIRKFKKRKVHSSFIDNFWGADLTDMQLINKFNKEFRFLCVINIYNKYAWVIPLKAKKGTTITNAFQTF